MSPKLRFQVQTDRQYRPLSGDYIIRLALNLSVSDLAETLPLHLCLLVDCSSSMKGTKMQKARESAKNLIQSLRDEDSFSLIGFASESEILLDSCPATQENQQLALNAIDNLEASGLTRLDDALDQAYQLLTKTGKNKMNALLVVGDGAPTDAEGYVLEDAGLAEIKERIAQAFLNHSIATSTIGLGDADACLAPFLERCGEVGGGIFYHAHSPDGLGDVFKEAFQRARSTAFSNIRFSLTDVAGHIRKASAVFPDIRELSIPQANNGKLSFEGGSLQKGEEHVFLMEIVTPGGSDPGKQKLCGIEATWEQDDQQHFDEAPPLLIEYTNDPLLLEKEANPQVEKYKSMYGAYLQTQQASENLRSGGDAKKTKVLLQAAAKTTRRLGMSKQTKLLEDMVQAVHSGEEINENTLAKVSVASRKTRILEPMSR